MLIVANGDAAVLDGAGAEHGDLALSATHVSVNLFNPEAPHHEVPSVAVTPPAAELDSPAVSSGASVVGSIIVGGIIGAVVKL